MTGGHPRVSHDIGRRIRGERVGVRGELLGSAASHARRSGPTEIVKTVLAYGVSQSNYMPSKANPCSVWPAPNCLKCSSDAMRDSWKGASKPVQSGGFLRLAP